MQRVMRLFHGDYPMALGALCLTLLLLLLTASFVVSPESAYNYSSAQLQPPSPRHWWGTDHLGRDCFARIAMGTRSSLAIGASSVLIGGVLGSLMGMVAAWYGGWVDLLLVRFLDALKAIPSILLALMVVAVFGSSLPVMIATISFLAISLYARMARSSTMQVLALDYIQWARLIGISNARIIWRHILPNIIGPLIVTASLGFANAILTEASLSYLGLGVRPPTPSWGRMLAEAQGYIFTAPWIVIGNTLVLTLLVIGFNLLGEGLQRRLGR